MTPSAPGLDDFGARKFGIPSLHMPLANASSASLRAALAWFGVRVVATPFLYDSFIRYSVPVYPGVIHDSRSPDIPPARNVRFQVAGDGAARGAGLGRGPGKACPICGRGGTLKRIVSRDPGKTVAVSVSVSHSACTARVRCGELSG